MPNVGKDELLRMLRDYQLFIIYNKFLAPTILKNFHPEMLPGYMGFAYKREDKEFKEISWYRNSDGTYSYNVRCIQDILLHPHFFPMKAGKPVRLSSEL